MVSLDGGRPALTFMGPQNSVEARLLLQDCRLPVHSIQGLVSSRLSSSRAEQFSLVCSGEVDVMYRG
jgi:hypothetical protein